MKFGIFDQNDRGMDDIPTQYSDRLDLAALYEELGFFCFHMSEHHGTPLSTTPSPSLFLAALSQRTSTLRFGPLVYLLPGYNPLRLAEEIAMLDNLSNGRFQFGVGRGASPHEMTFLGASPETLGERYDEAFAILREALSTGVLRHKGRYWNYDGIEMSIRPVQRPHPPIWIAVGSVESAARAAHGGNNIMFGGPTERARAVFASYLGERATIAEKIEANPLMGFNRYVVIADTTEEAMNIGREAWVRFYSHFIKLWQERGGAPAARIPENFDDLVASGQIAIGTADAVGDQLENQIRQTGANFLSCSFAFGGITTPSVRRSAECFAARVMPRLSHASEEAHAALLAA